MKKDFDKIVKALRNTNFPCNVILTKTEIYCILGWDYPDRFFKDIESVVDKLEIKSEVAYAADLSSPNIIDTIRINSGARTW